MAKRKALLTAEEDRAWTRAFEFYVNEGNSDARADRLAWKDVQQQFPRLKAFSGAKAGVSNPGRFRIEHVATKPAGWRVRTVTRGVHEIRVACPPGPRGAGECKLIEVLHPKTEPNPCGFRYLLSNPSELLIMGANPSRPKPNPSKVGAQIAAMKDRGASPREVGQMLSRLSNPSAHGCDHSPRKSFHKCEGKTYCRKCAKKHPHANDPAICLQGWRTATGKETDENIVKVQQRKGQRETGALGRIGMANPLHGFTVVAIYPELYEDQIRPRLRKSVAALSYDEYVRKYPGTYAVLNHKGKILKVGSRESVDAFLRPFVPNPHSRGELFTGEASFRKYERGQRQAARSVPASDPDRQRAVALYKKMQAGDNSVRFQIAGINARRGWSMNLVALWARGGGANPSKYHWQKDPRTCPQKCSLCQARIEEAERLYQAGLDRGKKTGSRRNPESAEAMYETFHGRGHKEILELQEPEPDRKLASLGLLRSLEIKPVSGREKIWIEFDPPTRLAANAQGTQLFVLGGDQSIRNLQDFGTDTDKEKVELGEAVKVVYRAAKSQTDFKTTDWEHKFGEEGGRRPIVGYDKSTRRVFILGGSYRIEAPGIIN